MSQSNLGWGHVVSCEISAESSWGRHYRKKKRRAQRIYYRQSRLYKVFDDISDLIQSFGMYIVDVQGTLSYRPIEREITEKSRRRNKEECLGFVYIKTK